MKSFWESRTLFTKRVLAAGGIFIKRRLKIFSDYAIFVLSKGPIFSRKMVGWKKTVK
jgi:hypothetical protein